MMQDQEEVQDDASSCKADPDSWSIKRLIVLQKFNLTLAGKS